MVIDAARRRLVFFGGCAGNGNVLFDTWLSHRPQTDLNDDGLVNLQDFLSFLASCSSGGCA
jgi:hypothetical protein